MNCSTLIQTLIAVRDKPNASIDEKITAIKVCIDRLPQIMRSLLFYKNTAKPDQGPYIDPGSPSGAA